MDSFIEFIVTIALVALFSLPSMLKKKADKKTAPDVMPETCPETEGNEDEIYDSDTVETWYNPKEEKGYFTYERMPEPSVAETRAMSTARTETAQVVEDKSNESSLLDFSEEELLKGVIYSEILKKKF